jgi:hypothetical protein
MYRDSGIPCELRPGSTDESVLWLTLSRGSSIHMRYRDSGSTEAYTLDLLQFNTPHGTLI